jgi:hypothetical protein
MTRNRDEKHLKYMYGITLAEYINMFDKQGSRCMICRVIFDSYPETLTRPCIDHNHITGKIRGILCMLCNSGLGMFRDSADNLEKAAAYMREQEARDDS